MSTEFDLENEGPDQAGEKMDLRHSTGNIRFYEGEFLEIVTTGKMRLRKRTHKHTDYKQNLQSRFAYKYLNSVNLNFHI